MLVLVGSSSVMIRINLTRGNLRLNDSLTETYCDEGEEILKMMRRTRREEGR